MLDLVNFNIGGGVMGGAAGSRGGSRGSGQSAVTQVTLPRAPDTDSVKYAKRIARLFDTAGLDYYGVAAALWDHAGDPIKRHLYALADALVEVAADKREAGLDFTLTEREISINSKALRDHLRLTGYFLDNEGEQ